MIRALEAIRGLWGSARERRAEAGAVVREDTRGEHGSSAPAPVGGRIGVVQVDDAEFFVGDLFRRRFRLEPPTSPVHYVAFHRDASGRCLPLGYVHYQQLDDSYLCGGLVVDNRAYRLLSAGDREAIRRRGGVAEILLRATFAELNDASAIWGSVGDKQSEAVCRRVGFVRTEHPYIMVAWRRDMPDDERLARLRRVIAHGPF